MVPLVKDYGRELSWNVGALFAHDRFMFEFFDICKQLRYEIPIKYVFGSIPCRLQGGRVAPRDASLEDACKIIEKYNSYGIGCRLTFSNMFIDSEALSDKLSNDLMKNLNTGNNNGIIISSDLLARHVRENYDNLQVIASQVKPSCEVGLGKDTFEYYNSLFDLYDIVVVNPFKVNDYEFLKNIKYCEKVEFITNHRCIPNCPRAKEHYETQMKLGNNFLTGKNTDEEIRKLKKINEECLNTKHQYPTAGTSFSQSEIELLSRMGFSQFKIEGRDNEGICFIRDMGDYIFNSHIYDRIASSIMEMAV